MSKNAPRHSVLTNVRRYYPEALHGAAALSCGWEQIERHDGCRTERLRVPGGWIVRSRIYYEALANVEAPAVALVFLPDIDPSGCWLVRYRDHEQETNTEPGGVAGDDLEDSRDETRTVAPDPADATDWHSGIAENCPRHGAAVEGLRQGCWFYACGCDAIPYRPGPDGAESCLDANRDFVETEFH